MNGDELIFKHAVAKTMQGHKVGEGKVVAYSIAPVVTIERADGSKFVWRYDMCEYSEQEEGAREADTG